MSKTCACFRLGRSSSRLERTDSVRRIRSPVSIVLYQEGELALTNPSRNFWSSSVILLVSWVHEFVSVGPLPRGYSELLVSSGENSDGWLIKLNCWAERSQLFAVQIAFLLVRFSIPLSEARMPALRRSRKRPKTARCFLYFVGAGYVVASEI